MALFLAVLGGAAVVEISRTITGGSKDVHQLKQREQALRRQLQEIQKELERSMEQRQLSEGEAAQLAAINQQLRLDREAASKEAALLKSENEELQQREARLVERQQLLESCCESLKLENGILLEQFGRLKAAHDNESAAFQEELAGLKASVGSALQQFTAGDTTADQLIAFLRDMGVELRCPTEDVAGLRQRLALAATGAQRIQVLDNVELAVEENWMERMKLASSSPHRAARLLMGGAAMAQQAAALCAPPAPAERRPLVTPRSLEAAAEQHRAAAAAAQVKLASHAVADVEREDTIAAVHAQGAGREREREREAVPALPVAAAAEPAVPGPPTARPTGQTRSLLFRPAKKAAKKAGSIKSQKALLQMDVELGAAGTSAVPRLSFDALHRGNDEDGLLLSGGSSQLAN